MMKIHRIWHFWRNMLLQKIFHKTLQWHLDYYNVVQTSTIGAVHRMVEQSYTELFNCRWQMQSIFYWINLIFKCTWKISMEGTVVILWKDCHNSFWRRLSNFTCFCNVMIFFEFLLAHKFQTNFENWLQLMQLMFIFQETPRNNKEILVKAT